MDLETRPAVATCMGGVAMMSSDGLAALKIDRSRRRRRVSPWVWIVLVIVFAGAVLSPRLMRGLQVADVSVAPAVRISAATGEAADGSPELTADEWRRRVVPQEVMPGWHAGAMLVRREAFDRVGPFRPELRVGEFIDWYARAVELGLKQRLLPEIVMLRRLHRDNLGVRALEQRSSSYLRVLKAALDRRRCGPS